MSKGYSYEIWIENNKEEIFNINSVFFLKSYEYLNINYQELMLLFNHKYQQKSLLKKEEDLFYFNQLFDIICNILLHHNLNAHAKDLFNKKQKFNKNGLLKKSSFIYFKEFLQPYIKEVNIISTTNKAFLFKLKINKF
jgi:hypothetical protein